MSFYLDFILKQVTRVPTLGQLEILEITFQRFLDSLNMLCYITTTHCCLWKLHVCNIVIPFIYFTFLRDEIVEFNRSGEL